MPFRTPRFPQLPWRSRAAIARDVDLELTFHLEMRVKELMAQGLGVEAAQRRAQDEFGDIEFTRSYCREIDERTDRATRNADRLAEWRQDARYTLRTLRRSPGFAAVSLLTLALAIGANTAIFTVARAVLLRPLPYGDPGSLVAIYESLAQDPSDRYPLSPPNFFDYRTAQRTLTGIAAYDGESLTWRPANGDPQIVRATAVTANAFDVLQVRPLHGRTFSVGDDAPGNGFKVVVSHGFWRRALGGTAVSAASSITLNGRLYDVIGVMPRGFTLDGDEEMWVPLDLSSAMADPVRSRKQHYLRVVGRVRTVATLDGARSDMLSIARRLEADFPEANTGRGVTLVPLHQAMTGDLRPALLLLQGAAAMVLLIACANLANLTLSRTMGRRREMALRAALGAGRARLVRQLLTESVLLAMAGGAIGVAVALVATRTLLALNPDALPAMFTVNVDGRVLLFSVALSVGTGVLFGLVPALDAARADLNASLKQGGRSISVGRGGERLRRALVVVQVGLAVMLLVGTGLLVRSLNELTRVRLGFDPDRVLTAQLGVSGARYDSSATVNHFYDGVLAEIARAPGIVAVGASNAAPTRGRIYSTIEVEGEPFDAANPPNVGYVMIRGDYFKAMRIPLMAGRAFDDTDTPDGPRTVILNQAAARRFFPGGDAAGRRVRLGPDRAAPWTSVVGVAGDIRDEGLDIDARPTVFVNHRQETWRRSLVVVIRTSGDPQAATPVLRRAVKVMDPTMALRDVRNLDAVIGSSLAPRRFALGLASCFAAVALLLAAIGIYGVLAYTVTARTREFGVRLALGATVRSVLMLVLGQGLWWSLLGLALGIGGALAGGRLLAGMLYGVSPLDAWTYASVVIALLVVVAAACLVPATRATRVDPLTSMRAE